MSLTSGTRFGAYEVLALIGAGGMGEVYRARDTKLNRDVAIKVLPEAFAADPDRLARFKREAQVLAALNHPNIAAIYGLEESDGASAIVMELVEGPTLADRLSQGAMSLDEGLPIARQIAEALEAAHEQGVVHRDLKPANVKVRPDGVVKVLDFGLAAVVQSGASADPQMTNSPTLSMQATRAGMILGTAGYMSPEQASGRAVDRRADIWAFGVVLFELVTGRRLFEGETIAHTLADVLRGEIDLATLPGDTPEPLRDLLRRCLDRDAKRRLRDIGEARIVLERAIVNPVDVGRTLSGPPSSPDAGRHKVRPTFDRFVRGALPWVVAGSAVIALIAVLAFWVPWRTPAPPPEVRLEITTPPTPSPASIAISPDGRQIVFVAAAGGSPRLWLRPLNSESAKVLVGTDGATNPFWSPDSRAIGFFADYKLKRIDLNGGSVQVLAIARVNRTGTWSRDGVILFGPSGDSPLFRISASGGEPVAVTHLLPQQQAHGFPRFLPDGRHFLYYAAAASPNVRGVYVGEIGSSDVRRLFDADTAAEYASSGHLLFVRQGTLLAQRFDPVRLQVAGEPFAVTEQVTVAGALGAFSVSGAGPFVYRTSEAGGRQFAWFGRSGKELSRVGSPHDANTMSLAPDGRRLVVGRTLNGNPDIWLLELERGIFSRFTSDAASEFFPLWSPDGNRIVFNSNRRQGVFDLYQKATIATGPEELLLATPLGKAAEDWSPDGRYLLYRANDPKTGRDLWVLPMDGKDRPFPVVQTQAEESNGQFSPDGRWLAYESDESGRFEIYAQPFPGAGARVQISTAGGGQARWRRDGKEIFYVALDGRLMAAPIRFSANGRILDVNAPVPLFATRVGPAVTNNRQQYIVSPDGQRFLMNTLTEETSPITVLLNWRPTR
jgi:serine/threonine protein kinase/Tol biopolymer transport system component